MFLDVGESIMYGHYSSQPSSARSAKLVLAESRAGPFVCFDWRPPQMVYMPAAVAACWDDTSSFPVYVQPCPPSPPLFYTRPRIDSSRFDCTWMRYYEYHA